MTTRTYDTATHRTDRGALVYAAGQWGLLGQEWRRTLAAEHKSANTIRIYLHAVRQLGDWANGQPEQYQPATIPTTALRDYIEALLQRSSAGNTHNHYRCLRTFFRWLADEDEIDRSPMDRMKAPILPERPVKIVTLEMMAALLGTCTSKAFVDRRDSAILRVYFDTGCRKGESLLTLDDVDLTTEAILVHGKGRRDRAIPVSPRTAQALSRYLRVRERHPQAGLPELWLGSTGQGPLRGPGIRTMLQRRGQEAGVGHIHPHMFRHGLAHYWQLEEGNDTDLMRIMGWKSRDMLSRYAASTGVQRAHATHRALRLGDRV